MLTKIKNRQVRAQRVRAKMSGTAECPRLSVFRSNTHISVQAIDDVAGKTLAAASDVATKLTGTKTERAAQVGKLLGEALVKMKIKTGVFDRGGFKFHGRVKALADAVRSAGVQF